MKDCASPTVLMMKSRRSQKTPLDVISEYEAKNKLNPSRKIRSVSAQR